MMDEVKTKSALNIFSFFKLLSQSFLSKKSLWYMGGWTYVCIAVILPSIKRYAECRIHMACISLNFFYRCGQIFCYERHCCFVQVLWGHFYRTQVWSFSKPWLPFHMYTIENISSSRERLLNQFRRIQAVKLSRFEQLHMDKSFDILHVWEHFQRNNSKRPVDALAEKGELLTHSQLEIKRC